MNGSMKMNEWTKRFLEKAKVTSTWSKDPSSQVGAVAINESRRQVSEGYNGFPNGIEDSVERLHNREEKYKYVVHAEKNLVYNACLEGQSLRGSTLYVYGKPVCSQCALGVISVGIKKVIVQYDDSQAGPWANEWVLSKEILDEKGIPYEDYDLDGNIRT